MKQNYYGYVLEEKRNKRKILMDLRIFLHHFSGYDSPDYKNRFTRSGEQVYLLRSPNRDVYLFLITRSNEIIKRVSTRDLSFGEINDMLARGERIGFVSFLRMERSSFGFASTVFAPRHAAFAGFMNDVFETVGVTDYRFVPIPFMHEASRAELMSLPFIGRTSIQVSNDSTVFEQLVEMFSGQVDEFRDVSSFEITLKPRQGQDISQAVKRILAQTPDEGLDTFLARGKEELGDQLVDYYLAGKGILSDDVTRGNDVEICRDMLAKAAENDLLIQQIENHDNDERFEQEEVESLVSFSNAAAWTRRFNPV